MKQITSNDRLINATKGRFPGLALVSMLSLLCQNLLASGPDPVDLQSAANFGVLAGSTITSSGASQINGGLGLSPGTLVTESPTIVVNGPREIANAAASTAQAALSTAYQDARTRGGAVTVSAELGGTTLPAGVYKSATGTFALSGILQLDAAGDPAAVWIFQMDTTLITAVNSSVILLNGAQAANVFWQVGSSATLGTGASLKGTILALTSITLNDGASISGRALAQAGAVTLEANSIAIPASKLEVAGFPNPQSAGLAGDLTVTAKDAFGSTVVDYAGHIHFSSSDPLAILPADYTFLSGDNGIMTFKGGVTLKTPGTQSITAMDTATPTIVGTQSNIAVNSADLVVTLVCPLSPIDGGTLATYTGSVSNSGNVTLNNVVVVNNEATPHAVLTVASLAPGKTAVFTTSFATPVDACSVIGMVTATGSDALAVTVITNTVSMTCAITTLPLLAVTQNCPVTPTLSGGLLTYSGTVSNAGNITLTNIVVVSDKPSPNTPVLTLATLAPGAFTNFTGSYIAPLNACTVVSTLTATGKGTCNGVSVTNSVATPCLITTSPNLAVTLNCPSVPGITGSLITYTGSVSNSGNVTLNNVTVVNNQPTPGTLLTLASLAPGGVSTFTNSFIAPSDACSVSSLVKAVGGDSCSGVLVTNTATAICPLLSTPLLAITQNCPVTPTLAGGLLTYSGTVSNAGNITLTNIVVVSDKPSPNTPVLTLATLAPGAFTNFTGSYIAPTNCTSTSTSTSTSTATARSLCGIAVTNKLSVTCPILMQPQITITAACSAAQISPGGLVTYTGTVKNAGNITLTNVVVYNNMTGSTPVFTIATLAPGATATFSGSYNAPTDACSVTATLKATGEVDCPSI